MPAHRQCRGGALAFHVFLTTERGATMSEKTHKGLKERLKKTASGRVFHRRRGSNHLMSKKRAKRARRLRKWKELSEGELRSFRRQYGRL